jgi:replicative DNA helicase
VTTANQHARHLLAAIIPGRTDLLDRALRDLTPEQIPDLILSNLFRLLERFYEKTEGIMSRRQLTDLLNGARYDPGTIAAYQENYDELYDLPCDEVAYRWAIDQIRDLAANRSTKETLTQAMAIITQGLDGEDGVQLRGHVDARTHVMARFADIDRSMSLHEAPEGDIRTERDAVLADYEKQEAAQVTGSGIGVNFGVPPLDDRVGGLHRGELVLVVAYTSDGKAQSLNSLVLTPSGFTRMGDLSIGDLVVDPKGEPSKVTGIFPQGTLPLYRLTFSDGSTAEASGDHLWSVRVWKPIQEKPTQRGVRGKQVQTRVSGVMTTDQIREMVENPKKRNPVLDTSEELIQADFDQRGYQTIDPYLLGLLLGDGYIGTSITFTNPDPELAEYVGSNMPEGMDATMVPKVNCPTFRLTSQYYLNPLGSYLSGLGLRETRSWDKFVPEAYLWTTAANRLAILQGLMDTDGGHERGRATFSSASEQLRDDVIWLARSLGFRAEPMKDKIPTYTYLGEKKEGRVAYRCSIWEREDARVFRLARKIKPLGSRDAGRRVESVEYVRDAECQCISVSAPSKLYVTNDFVPTHNTSLCVQLAWSATVEQRKNVLFLTTETVRDQVRRRILARHSCLPIFGPGDGLNSRDILHGTLSREDKRRFEATVDDFHGNTGYGRCYVAQVPRGASMTYIESKIVRVGRLMHIDLVVMDYLALLRPERKRNTMREELSSTLISAKQLSTTANDGDGVPFVSPWQVSRTARVEAEQKGCYTLSGLSETAETSNSADTVISLLAPFDNQHRLAKVKAQIMKHRDGEKANAIELRVDYATSRFDAEFQQRTRLDTTMNPLNIFA